MRLLDALWLALGLTLLLFLPELLAEYDVYTALLYFTSLNGLLKRET
ncbi:MAG: hypothetical protein FGF53_06350 [Candidatus Brockarchaeota archaeon]|nr:hypothetical protein [Candidatus Brockarchaeota archaeon]